jgi:hypothetical protein
MNSELERYAARATDRHLIPGIYNYCHRRCERCPFTARCLTFIDIRDQEARHPGGGVLEHVHESFRDTFAFLEAWCERGGIDFGALGHTGNSPGSVDAIPRADAATEPNPLRLARAYTHAAFRIVKALDQESLLQTRTPEVRDAIETIGWYGAMVSAKIVRALGGFADGIDDVRQDAIQNDWNGSAKIARLAIAESRDAWEVLYRVGRTSAGAPIRQMRAVLDRIDTDLAARFPHAMEFVRPGFDEPHVAAGALTVFAVPEPLPR